MAKKTAADSAALPSFEEALKRLESIVEELEGGELSLEESISRYEEGMKLSRALTQKLDEAEKRIERLVEDPDGTTSTEPIELDSREGGREGELPLA
jgi:exodeoxyribonuclease VII small subunit